MKTQNIFKYLRPMGLCAVLILSGCKKEQKTDEAVMTDNILLQEWTGPYQGVPAFDKMKVDSITRVNRRGSPTDAKPKI